MIDCIAIDDEPLALDLIAKFCSQIDFLDLKKTFTKTSEALHYMEKFPVDLIFLDIQMPEVSGISFCKSLNDNILVIFTTAFSEYAVEGFNLKAVDYLLKPISFSRFEQAALKTKDYQEYIKHSQPENNHYLIVRSEYKLHKIVISKIKYIKALDNYIRIITDNSKPVTSHLSLKAVSEKLPEKEFMRVHRSFIINIGKEVSYSNKVIHIGSTQIPVGVSYEENVRRFFGIKQNR
jgi:DNA-binding LytR/AlgR family response regulator